MDLEKEKKEKVKKLKFIGIEISKDGIRPGQGLIQELIDLKQPTYKQDLRVCVSNWSLLNSNTMSTWKSCKDTNML